MNYELMNLLYLTTVNVSDSSAQSHQIKSMSSAFSKRRDLNFLLIGFSSKKEKMEFPAILLDCRRGKLLRTIVLILYVLRSNFRDYKVFTRDLYVAFFFVVLGKKVVWEAHQETSSRSKLFLRFMGAFKKFNVLTISEALKESKEIPINSCKIYAYHDGIEKVLPKVDTYRQKQAVYTGALHKGKDVDSLEPLFANFPDWSFVIIGGKDEEVSLYQRKFSIYPNVSFMGRLSRSEVEIYQRNAHILLFPLTKSNKLWKYTSPLKLFEYMNSSRPILASNIGSVSEIIDETNAFTYSSEIEIVSAFKRAIYADPVEIDDKINRCRESLISTYNWKARVEFILNRIYGDK